MDMLRRCREQFAHYGREHRAKAADVCQTDEYREQAKRKAAINEGLVEEIDATLSAWGA